MKNTKKDIIKILIKRIKEKDQCAFEEFYNKTYMSIYRFVAYFISNSADCEDVVAEIYYNILYNSERILVAKNTKAYIYGIARYEVYKQLRIKQKNRFISIEDIQIDIASRVQNANEKLEEKETLLLLSKAINSLPDQCKLVYVLVREEKMKYKEVAELLTLTEGTVKQHMHQAIKRITKYIKEQLPTFKF